MTVAWMELNKHSRIFFSNHHSGVNYLQEKTTCSQFNMGMGDPVEILRLTIQIDIL